MAARKSGEALVYKRIAIPKLNETDPTDNPSFGDMWIDISVNPPVVKVLDSLLAAVTVAGGSLTPPVTITGTNTATVPLTVVGAAGQIADVFDIKSNTLKLLSFNLTPAALTGVLDIRNIPSGASAISATAPDNLSTAFLAKSGGAGADWLVGLDSSNFSALTLIDGNYGFSIAAGRDYGAFTSYFSIICPTNNLDPVFNNTAFSIADNANVRKLKIDIKELAGSSVKRFTVRLVRYDTQTGNILEIRNEADSTLLAGFDKNGAYIVDGATPVTSGTQIGFGNTTTTSASAGANGAVPAQVVGYLSINIGGTVRKIPFFAT